MNTTDFNTMNPGEQLRKFLQELIPMDSLDFNIEEPEENNFLARIDWILRQDNQLGETLYNSTINFLLRKIVKSAFYYYKYSLRDDTYDYIEDGIRQNLLETTRFAEDDVEKIISYLIPIISHSQSRPSKGLKRKIAREAQDNNTPCYICGAEIDFENEKSWEFKQVEHIWPKRLGGSNKEMNLRIACRKCNHFKEEYIDSSDFHYEYACYQTDLEEHQNHEEFKYAHKLAVWAKSSYTCTICGRGTEEVGTLKFKRDNPNDTWHYLNMSAYCTDHFEIN